MAEPAVESAEKDSGECLQTTATEQTSQLIPDSPDSGHDATMNSGSATPRHDNEPILVDTPSPKRMKLSPPEPQSDSQMATSAEVTPVPSNLRPDAQDGSPNPEKLTKRQTERLEKQKLREIERIAREKKKEDERKQKLEERERKELERKQKKEALEREKEQKREQERLRKEERRLRMEADKRKKEEDRKQKEEERKQKEEERKLKEEEKRRKEEAKSGSQMKISNFFSKQSVSTPASSVANKISALSLSATEAPKESEQTAPANSYDTDFLPFFQKRNVVMAPSGQLSPTDLDSEKAKFDSLMKSASTEFIFSGITHKGSEASKYTTSQELVEAINAPHTTKHAMHELVKNLPSLKYLQFYENAKPPYVGTWCSEKHISSAIGARNPLDTALTGYDYNYDSDLDWQDGDEGEGEDIDDLEEGEEEEDDAEDDEMEDFVDNNDNKRRIQVGPLQSMSMWNDFTPNKVFDDLRYEMLELDISMPIDPNKDYWTVPKPAPKPTIPKEKQTMSLSQLGTPVKPEGASSPNVLTPQKPVIKDAKVLEDLVKFIQNNSDFTIGTLSELAKKEFKVYTKSILKHTIQEVAFYNKKNNSWEIKHGPDAMA